MRFLDVSNSPFGGIQSKAYNSIKVSRKFYFCFPKYLNVYSLEFAVKEHTFFAKIFVK